MEIVEKDFTIKHNGDCWTLSFLKSKKELKEDSKESYKLGGYFTNITNAFRVALLWRQDKKYPFAESADEFKDIFRQYKLAFKKLQLASIMFHESIFVFKRKVFDGDRKI